MECFYINLDAAAGRRAAIEANFAAHKKDGWSLTRFAAIDAAYIQAHHVAGASRPGEKGCYLSHQQLIRQNLHNPRPVLLLEDDAVFGARTCETLELFLASENNRDWDILFTDLVIAQPDFMVALTHARHQIMAASQVRVFDLAGVRFAGSTAYLLNAGSQAKLLALLENEQALDLPYDLFLRKLIAEKKINARFLFPFVTTISDHASDSQIERHGQEAGALADLVWNTFRKMSWLERDLARHRPLLEQISRDFCDEDARMVGVLLAAMSSSGFQMK